MTYLPNRLGVLAAVTVLTISQLGCGGGSPAPTHFDTPQACFDAAKEAVANKDPLTFCNCLTEESQDTVAGAFIVMGGVMKTMSGMASLGGAQAAEQAQKNFAGIDAVLKKHGVTEDALKKASALAQGPQDPAAMHNVADVVHDKPTFIAEMIGAMEQMAQGPSFVEKMSEEFMGELKDVKIEGDKATAMLAGPDHERPIEFRKTATGWKLHIGSDELNAAPPAP
jgi:hypothetical protein